MISNPRPSRLHILAAAGLALVAVAALAAAPPALAAGGPKVVIIGFDGADPNLVDRYMAEGLLPNLEALKNEGTYSPLLPTNPPQTPVSWSAFSTGLNPGRTEIFDFLQHPEGSYTPDFALAERKKRTFGYGAWNKWLGAGAAGLVFALVALLVGKLLRLKTSLAVGCAVVVGAVLTFALSGPLGKALPLEVPDAENNRQGKPFWTVAAENGWRVGVVRVPVTFPAEELPAGSNMVSGLGVPDIRGRVGTPTSGRRTRNSSTPRTTSSAWRSASCPPRAAGSTRRSPAPTTTRSTSTRWSARRRPGAPRASPQTRSASAAAALPPTWRTRATRAASTCRWR